MFKKRMPLQREAHLEVRGCKAPVKNLGYGQLLDVQMSSSCLKSVRHCGAKHIWKSKISKTRGLKRILSYVIPLFGSPQSFNYRLQQSQQSQQPEQIQQLQQRQQRQQQQQLLQ